MPEETAADPTSPRSSSTSALLENGSWLQEGSHLKQSLPWPVRAIHLLPALSLLLSPEQGSEAEKVFESQPKNLWGGPRR